MIYLSYVSLLDVFIFTSIDEEKEEQKSTPSTIFEGCLLLKFGEKKSGNSETQLALNNLNIQKLNSLQSLVKDIPEIKLSHKLLSKQNYPLR